MITKPLSIQTFLRDPNNGLGELKKAPYKLSISVGENERRVGFKYNQVKSDLSHPICQEARGLILDRENNWNVVSFAFPKFFNAAENEAEDIDWDSAVAYEKMDGTCCVMYHFGGHWRVQTLGTVDASGPVQLDAMASREYPEWDGKTFADLFWEAFDRMYGDLDTTPLDPDLIYTFELCTPINRVVVQHDQWKLPLIGVRDRRSLEEYPVEQDRFSFFDRPKTFQISEFGDAVQFCEEELEERREGVVIRDKFFRRIKLKTESYRKHHRIKSGMLQRKHGIVELVQKGLDDDFVGAFPGFNNQVEEVKAGMRELEEELEDDYAACGGRNTDPDDNEARKEFALKVERWVDHEFRGLMFSRLEGEIDSFMEGLRECGPEDVAKHI